MNQLNQIFLGYLRSSLRNDFFHVQKGVDSKHITMTEPVDIDYEQHVMTHYILIVKHLLTEKEQFSTLEADMELLDKD